MKARDEKLKAIVDWAENSKNIRAVLLTSSLANPSAPVDEFSDLDIELVCTDNTSFITDNSWLQQFGKPISMIEEDASYFNNRHAMKMVLYEDGVKVDFKLYSLPEFLEDIKQDVLPEDWDIGYKVIMDKDGITQQMQPPTYRIAVIQKPSAQRFRQLINDFWWDTTYVAKCLARDEIFYAKFMSETNIRSQYLVPLIEWHIANQHNWNITTNKYGRLFKKHLNQAMWQKAEQTFSGGSINDNWNALFAMADLVSEMATDLSGQLGYAYPHELEKDTRNYLLQIRDK